MKITPTAIDLISYTVRNSFTRWDADCLNTFTGYSIVKTGKRYGWKYAGVRLDSFKLYCLVF